MPRPSVDSEASGPFKMFGRSKKPVEEPRKEVDLTSALPASDDFRTSLLMTGLSARFSMLREQDDPSSKLGKASDDSVLFPKRQSRMDFGLGSGLHDIAEDASIRAPPFARMDSFQSSDDTASMTGSVMNRGKPTEGNNLFGGRQKIYKITAGGTSGRTLYDDDVAQSAFQKWRASEKERSSFEDGPERYDTLRPDSPDFNRWRETSSTTSSAPSAGRNSTAATSIVSQPPSSFKDSHPPPGTPNSDRPSAFPERSVTRTRRLYEQGLNQELENSQTSAKSRFDGLSKGRFSGRAGDLPYNSSSPTSIHAPERPGERRAPIMSKASAPNLRSFSPPTSGSAAASPAESSSRFPNMDRTAQATSPPLSPPISETEEHPTLAIGANDHGKATAMGFFNRPVQQYDENRYAQRQRQLQQGRETPTSRYRTESSGSVPTTRSRSSSSLNRTPLDKTDSSVKPEPTVRDKPGSTFLDIDDDDDEEPAPLRSSSGGHAPQVTLARPDDHEHPAFRQSALPTPLSLSSRTSEDGHAKPGESPEDSPTLGPGSGLSGMVRQHLRNASTASSNYGPQGQDDDDEHYKPGNNHNMDLGVGHRSNPWDNDDIHPHTEELIRGRDAEPTPVNGRETDEFARHLADGAQRVRDRLTTYAESEASRSTSPAAPLPPTEDELPPPRTSAFSVLRSKSSRGSLASRSRERGERSRSRPAKGLGLKTSAPPSPPAARPSVDGHSDASGAPRKQSGERTPDKDDNAHAGLKAFRQARRELQRMKEQEVRQRHGNQIPSAPTSAPPPPPPQARERSSGQGQDRGPPPVTYNRMPSGESGSRAPSERDRSGSEASNGGHTQYRPRLRTGSSAYEDQRPQSPGYHQRPSTDSRRSPMMPPYSSHSDAFPQNGSRPGSSTGHFPQTSSTPNLPTSGNAPPPLPPINPRRKGVGSPLPYDDARMMSPDKTRSMKSPQMMSDDEKGVSQYRQRLRKVTSEGNGIASRSRPPPPPQSTMPDSNQPGGMF